MKVCVGIILSLSAQLFCLRSCLPFLSSQASAVSATMEKHVAETEYAEKGHYRVVEEIAAFIFEHLLSARL